jgi:hypothetical protein
MISARKPARAAATSESAVSRRLGDLRDIAAILKRSGLSPLETCRVVVDGGALDLKTRAFFAGLPAEEKHYWIASFYALLMPEARRRKLAAYFTPPHLATHAIAILARAGIALPSSIACYNIYTQRFVAFRIFDAAQYNHPPRSGASDTHAVTAFCEGRKCSL